MTQKQFDFDRGDQLGLLDAVPITSMDVPEGKSTQRVSGATIRSVLRAIDSFCRGDRVGWPSDATLGKVISRSERQVRRAVKALEKLNFVVVESPPGKPRRFRINWGEISLAASGLLSPATSEPLTGGSEGLTVTSEPSSDEADYKRTKKRGRNPRAKSESTKSDRMNEVFEAALPLAVEAYAVLRPSAPNDRQLIARAAVLAVTQLSEQWWSVSLGGISKCATDKPMAKFQEVVRDHAARKHDADFDTLAKEIRVPRVFYQRWQSALREKHRPPSTRLQRVESGDLNSRRRELREQLGAIE